MLLVSVQYKHPPTLCMPTHHKDRPADAHHPKPNHLHPRMHSRDPKKPHYQAHRSPARAIPPRAHHPAHHAHSNQGPVKRATQHPNSPQPAPEVPIPLEAHSAPYCFLKKKKRNHVVHSAEPFCCIAKRNGGGNSNLVVWRGAATGDLGVGSSKKAKICALTTSEHNHCFISFRRMKFEKWTNHTVKVCFARRYEKGSTHS